MFYCKKKQQLKPRQVLINLLKYFFFLCIYSKQFPYSKFPGAGNLANAIGVMIALIAILVTYIVYEPNFKREEPYEKLQ